MSGDLGELVAGIEAVLFAAGEPVSTERLAELFDDVDREAVRLAIEAVAQRYAAAEDRGLLVEEVAGGWRMVTSPRAQAPLRRFLEERDRQKLSMAALETLAIVAYRQPISGPEIQELRGKSSGAVLKTLLERRLIRICGRKEVVGRPFLYATTREFLIHFGLKTLKELPPLEEFEEVFDDGSAAPVPGATLSGGAGA